MCLSEPLIYPPIFTQYGIVPNKEFKGKNRNFTQVPLLFPTLIFAT